MGRDKAAPPYRLPRPLRQPSSSLRRAHNTPSNKKYGIRKQLMQHSRMKDKVQKGYNFTPFRSKEPDVLCPLRDLRDHFGPLLGV